VNAVLEKFPKNPHLLAFKQPEEEDYNLGPDIKDMEWKDTQPVDELEKLTGSVNTLLPISFLAVGLQKARAVARVYIKKGSKAEVGTGFLVPGNVFVTNNHVIKDKTTAEAALLQFDYEESADGNPVAVTGFKLDPAKGFATSVAGDWTAIKVKGDANATFGALEPVENIAVKKDDFVNIIQHPGGRYKQIALYHNMVTFSDDKIVQYLTDTEPGSSGSPVFNSGWQLVALHHSGGMLREPGSTQRLLRNEGININVVIAGLKANNLL
jgi:V8-like Glu-specific endopeptidase